MIFGRTMSTYAYFISSKLRGELGLKITTLQIVYIVQNEILSGNSVIEFKTDKSIYLYSKVKTVLRLTYLLIFWGILAMIPFA
ncbi:hypothetical protein DUG83_12740 [Vibrio parahaemolyticus]|nr:hypothetical protein [Vibrio parahaemolyticus]